ncbi:MAG TPA: GntR family transcriptional regulator [Polyangiaceae bacterium]|nr:GntR family transcriptional regulator [Polyangiaceae bacterium]
MAPQTQGVARGDPEPSVVDVVTTELVRGILSGRWPSGARLPPERDLAEELAVSRVSVRSAIGRLAEWGVVTARQGSGITVQPRRRWTAGVLANVIAHAIESGDFAALVPLLRDARALRRWVVLDMLERAAAHFGADARGVLDGVRARVEAAWAARSDSYAFLAIDRETLPEILEVAGMLPSLFLVNSLAAPYFAVMRTVPGASPVLADYREQQMAVIDAVERGDGACARARMSAYLDQLDAQVLGFLPDDVRGALEG